ncbi:MAG TPA: prepilin-type N-terminal cleavage/methylation domain-containing protein [Candidatus Nanoarchaeia archaeon]|nr:prepilin-type N-terminal cleavage/methylation domain-containing protein [Candidatus Nanoarchaeia archaeon]
MTRQRGFTLIELIFSFAILGAVLASCFALSNRAFRQGQEARSRVIAANLAQEQIEGLRNFRDNTIWAAFQANVPAGTGFHMDSTSSHWVPKSGSYNDPRLGGANVAIVGSYSPANEFNYSVTVTWPSASGPPFTTILYSKLVDIGGVRPK